MIKHFAVHSFCPLCRPNEPMIPVICTNVLVDVNCTSCLKIVNRIAEQANQV